MTSAGDLFDVSGKVVVVTGGSRGIGEMIAAGFVRGGARVYISSRKADACQAVADELSADGECIAAPADLAQPDGIRRLVDTVGGREPRVHVLVNNAGVTWGAPLEEYPDDGFDRVFALNVRAAFRATVEFLPLLRAAASEDDPARVINVGSIEGLTVPAWENYAYPASKAAVHMLTRQLAHRLAGESVTVNAIAPGLFPSRMTAFVSQDPEASAAVEQVIPLRRWGRPEDMAGVTLFLASRAGSYLTGAVIPVDGGVSQASAAHG
jgi:NAD(P)-dependent dehydrogenase (short-subunit alcohol dehydrogenase family)